MSERFFSNQLLEGARNCILKCGGVEKGTNVLILNLINDPGNPVDEAAVHALATIAQETEANVQILWSTGMEKSWWSDVPPIVVAAWNAADVVVSNALAFGRGVKAIREAMFKKKTIRIRNQATTVSILGSEWARFPFELSDEITRTVGEHFEQVRSWRVVADNGTDIGGKVGAVPTVGTGMTRYGQKRREKQNRPFPQGCFNPITSEDANGIIVFDRTLPWEARYVGVPEVKFTEPLKITVEKNRMVHFEGGFEAGCYRRFYESLVPYLGDDAWNVSGWHAGIHPKAKVYESPQRNPDVMHRAVHNHPSVMHFHLGGSIGKEYDYPYMWHLSNEIEGATIYLDGEKLYDRGHLMVLDDSTIKSLAAQYGDPEMLLKEIRLYE